MRQVPAMHMKRLPSAPLQRHACLSTAGGRGVGCGSQAVLYTVLPALQCSAGHTLDSFAQNRECAAEQSHGAHSALKKCGFSRTGQKSTCPQQHIQRAAPCKRKTSQDIEDLTCSTAPGNCKPQLKQTRAAGESCAHRLFVCPRCKFSRSSPSGHCKKNGCIYRWLRKKNNDGNEDIDGNAGYEGDEADEGNEGNHGNEGRNK